MKITKYIIFWLILIIGTFLILNYANNDIKLKRIYSTSTDNINYEISVIYFSNSYLDKIFKNQIIKEIDSFKKESAEFFKIAPHQTTLYISQDIFNYNQDIVSFKTDTYKNTGGAHGISHVDASIINLKEKKEINSSDLIIDIEKLSQLITSKIKENNLVEPRDIFAEGLDPEINNFNTFILNPNFVTFYFNPYQIAPYYYGTIEVNLLNSELEGIFNFDILK